MNHLLLELIRRASTQLPRDIVAALAACHGREEPGSRAAGILETIRENNALASETQTPICQDTGALTFFFKLPTQIDSSRLESIRIETLQDAAWQAVRLATKEGLLRKNTIATLTGASLDDNTAPGTPACHFEPGEPGALEVWLLSKGGGSENVSRQYSLPDESLNAGRDLAGVRACVLDAVWRAQGQGCAPGVIGLCVGGDRASGHLHAKKQLLRPLGDSSPEPKLAALEQQLLSDANTLGIGPMGLGGAATLLGVKAAALPRVPASYFATVAYSCWALRRHGFRAAADGAVAWLE